MARLHYWQYIVDNEGRPLKDVTIRFYLADQLYQEAEIYTHPSLGAATTTSSADIKTDSNGFFEFWVGDEFETLGGYEATQKFQLTWQKAGIMLGTLDNIDIYPTVFQVDQTDNSSSTKDEKNKLVSNQLAYNWENHRTQNVPTSQPHDMQPVDRTDTNTTKNKLVSNNLINYLLALATSAGTVSIGASAATERNFSVTSWTASGDLYKVDLNHFIGRQYPLVQVRIASSKLKMEPAKIKSIDTDTIRLFVANEFNAEVTIVG